MPTYKDEARGSWYVSFYYVDRMGNRKLKKKRGFATQREAKQYERDFLNKEIQDYISRLYAIQPDDKLFYFTKGFIGKEIDRLSAQAGVKRIRTHDLRHSHASLLIDMGYSIFLISERLGHENVDTTMNTYGHLYPNKHSEMVEGLEKLR